MYFLSIKILNETLGMIGKALLIVNYRPFGDLNDYPRAGADSWLNYSNESSKSAVPNYQLQLIQMRLVTLLKRIPLPGSSRTITVQLGNARIQKIFLKWNKKRGWCDESTSNGNLFKNILFIKRKIHRLKKYILQVPL